MCISQSKIYIQHMQLAGAYVPVYVMNKVKVVRLFDKQTTLTECVSTKSLSKNLNNTELSFGKIGCLSMKLKPQQLTASSQQCDCSESSQTIIFSWKILKIWHQVVYCNIQVCLPMECYLYLLVNVLHFKRHQEKIKEKFVALKQKLQLETRKFYLPHFPVSTCYCISKVDSNSVVINIWMMPQSVCDIVTYLPPQTYLKNSSLVFENPVDESKCCVCRYWNWKNANIIRLCLNYKIYARKCVFSIQQQKTSNMKNSFEHIDMHQCYKLLLHILRKWTCKELDRCLFRTLPTKEQLFIPWRLLLKTKKPKIWIEDSEFTSSHNKPIRKNSRQSDKDSEEKAISGITQESIISDKLLSPPSGDVHREVFRMSTFAKLPQTIRINAQQYAKAGFYYLGVSDSVKCFACDNVMQNLTPQMDPFLLRMHRTTCKFTRKEDNCGNIPIHPVAPSTFVRRQPSAGEILMSRNQNNAPTLLSNQNLNPPAVAPPSVVSTANLVNTPNAPAPIPPPVHGVPLMRHMANIIDPDHERFLRQLDLCQEVDRVRSFTASWPRDTLPSPRRMANAGWFYLGNIDRTQCFSCGGVLRNWTRMDNPAVEHLSHFPSCAMAQGCEPRNVPETSEPSLPPISTRSLTAEERIGLREMFPCEFPSTPHMAQLDNRLATYMNWLYTRATPRMVAEAGFFSLGVRDRVKCYYCNGGLQNWRRNDDPWEQHAKWYPTCEFVLQNKGVEYVHSVVARYPDIDRPIPRAQGLDVAPSSTAHSPPEVQENQQPSRSVLDEAMDSEVALAIVGMGFEPTLVREVMQIRIDEQGDPYSSASELLEAVVGHGERRQNEDSRQAESVPAPSTASRSTSFNFHSEDVQQGGEEDIYQSSIEQMQEEEGRDVPESMPSASSFHSVDIVSGSHDNQEHMNSHEDEGIDESTRLRRRLDELTSERLCKVCLDRRADMVFIPCNHICCCMECTRALRFCPICRVRIEKGIRTFSHTY